jgi:hypothetical protein
MKSIVTNLPDSLKVRRIRNNVFLRCTKKEDNYIVINCYSKSYQHKICRELRNAGIDYSVAYDDYGRRRGMILVWANAYLSDDNCLDAFYIEK